MNPVFRCERAHEWQFGARWGVIRRVRGFEMSCRSARFLGLVGPLLALPAAAAQKPSFDVDPVVLDVALVDDPDFPKLDERLVQRALVAASATYRERFDVAPPEFRIVKRYDVYSFLSQYARVDDLKCARLFGARYLGGGAAELRQYKEQATTFFKRWDLDALKGFVEPEARDKITSYEDIYGVYESRYVSTIEKLKGFKTPKGTPLASPERSRERSYVAWTCALSLQDQYDVVLTNTFIMADLLSEPHPHAVFGKARIGGIAGPSPARKSLEGQALLATTFGIDTKIEMLSELGGKPASLEERARILGSYLLAHEIAHAVFGIPDVFDHPEGRLMTSRPGTTYREGLKELDAHPGPCAKCRDWVEARSSLDQGRNLHQRGDDKTALELLAKASKQTPKHFHGGYKRRMSEISRQVALAYAGLGDLARAKRFAETAKQLDPRSAAVRSLLETLAAGDVSSVVSSQRSLPVSATSTPAKSSTELRD